MWWSLVLEKLKVQHPGKACGLIKDKPRYSETSWWNDDVWVVVIEEKKLFSLWERRGCETDRERYQEKWEAGNGNC